MGIKNDLERYVAKRLNEVDTWASQTIASGAVFGDQDVRSAHYLAQCKEQHSMTRHTISCKEWNKVEDVAFRERTPDGDYRTPIYVTQIGDTTLVSMEFEEFLALVRKGMCAEREG